MRKSFALANVACLAVAAGAFAQSSSLYVDPVVLPEPLPSAAGVQKQTIRLERALGATSFTTVLPPEPRAFAIHDLVTIIVRESSEASSTAELETEKESKFDGKLAAFPDLQLDHLLDFVLKPSESLQENAVELDLEASREFDGSGNYKRKDSVTSRITAQIIDVKPNGLLVLEARKYIRNDREELELVLTGTCRADDVEIDNTVLSTQLHDLRLNKQHSGELRRATKKGLITKVLEGLFSF